MDAAPLETLLHVLTATGSKLMASRRGLGRVLAGLTLGAALVPLLGPDDGEAKKDKNKKKKDSPPPMEPPMDPPLDPGTPPMEPPPKKRRRGHGRRGDRGGWFQP